MASESSDSLRELQSISDKLTNIARLSAEYHLQLSAVFNGGGLSRAPVTSYYTHLIKDMDQRLRLFEDYATCFANTLVCGAFDRLVSAHRLILCSRLPGCFDLHLFYPHHKVKGI